MKNKDVACVGPFLFRQQLHESRLNLLRRALLRPTESLRNASNVRIDNNPFREIKYDTEHNVRGFSSLFESYKTVPL